MMNLIQPNFLNHMIKIFFILTCAFLINDSKCFTHQSRDNSEIKLPTLVGINEPAVAGIIQYLRNSISIEDLKKKTNRNLTLLIHGSTGNGKTSLVYDIAKASECELVFQNGSSIVGMNAGEGAANIALLFKRAEYAFERSGKPVMLVIDGIDIIATDIKGESTREFRRAYEELLRKLDEYKDDPRFVIICTTTVKNKLEKDLLNRFNDNFLELKNPDAAMREKILRHYADKFDVSLNDNVIKELVNQSNSLCARLVEGFIKSASRSQKINKQSLSDNELLAKLKHLKDVQGY